MLHSFNVPATIVAGAGASAELPDQARRLGARRALLVTDRFLEAGGLPARLAAALAAAGVATHLFADVQPDPTDRNVADGLAALRAHEADARVTCTAPSYLSDRAWNSATNAWGPVERDQSNGEQAADDGRPITLNGVVYPRGLGVHAGSELRYSLGGACTSFQAAVGVDDKVGTGGSVVFQVWADAAKVSESAALTGASATAQVNVSVAGASELRLVVTDGGNGNGGDHADWADAHLICPPLAAASVTSVNDNTLGSAANQFEYVGAWSYGSQSGAYQSDNHWSNASGAYYQVDFSGSQVDLYMGKAPSHGIAAVSIDGGPETMVDLYAAARADQSLVYTSPTLAAGAHTLKVRVTATRNPSSGGTFVIADRVDIR
jgi:hypothetical protein